MLFPKELEPSPVSLDAAKAAEEPLAVGYSNKPVFKQHLNFAASAFASLADFFPLICPKTQTGRFGLKPPQYFSQLATVVGPQKCRGTGEGAC
jgi:hypothetical protein